MYSERIVHTAYIQGKTYHIIFDGHDNYLIIETDPDWPNTDKVHKIGKIENYPDCLDSLQAYIDKAYPLQKPCTLEEAITHFTTRQKYELFTSQSKHQKRSPIRKGEPQIKRLLIGLYKSWYDIQSWLYEWNLYLGTKTDNIDRFHLGLVEKLYKLLVEITQTIRKIDHRAVQTQQKIYDEENETDENVIKQFDPLATLEGIMEYERTVLAQRCAQLKDKLQSNKQKPDNKSTECPS